MAGKSDDTWFTKWLRNGRLSAICWLVVFVVWVVFQFADARPESISTLNNLLLTFSGILVGNLAISKDSKSKSKEESDE